MSAAKTISAVLALRRRHVPTIKAKRAVEAAIEGFAVTFEAPMVEDAARLVEELHEFGFLLTVDASASRETANMPA